MNVTVNDLLLIIGQKETELIVLRQQLSQLESHHNEQHAPKPPSAPMIEDVKEDVSTD